MRNAVADPAGRPPPPHAGAVTRAVLGVDGKHVGTLARRVRVWEDPSEPYAVLLLKYTLLCDK